MWDNVTNWYWLGPVRNSLRTVILYIPPKNSEQKHFPSFLPRGRHWSSESFGDLPGSHSLNRVPDYPLQNPSASSWMNGVTPQTEEIDSSLVDLQTECSDRPSLPLPWVQNECGPTFWFTHNGGTVPTWQRDGESLPAVNSTLPWT